MLSSYADRLRLRAIADDPVAQNELGRRLWCGRNIRKNRTLALKWLRRSAATKNVENEGYLGWLLCCEGRNADEIAEGFKWLQKAGMNGHVQAQYDIGVSYALGEFVRRNPKQARKWYQRAANAGHTEALYNLGVMHWEGDGGPQSREAAHKCWLKAASQGDLLAQSLLADAYEVGSMGFKVDKNKARYWRRGLVRG